MARKSARPSCEHPAFETVARILRITDNDGALLRFDAEVHIRCGACGVRFRWIGLAMGSHPAEPRTSVDGFELRAPIEPDAHATSLMAANELTRFPSPPHRAH